MYSLGSIKFLVSGEIIFSYFHKVLKVHLPYELKMKKKDKHSCKNKTFSKTYKNKFEIIK